MTKLIQYTLTSRVIKRKCEVYANETANKLYNKGIYERHNTVFKKTSDLFPLINHE